MTAPAIVDALAALALLPGPSGGRVSLSILAPRGRQAAEAAALGWGLIAVATVVFVIFLACLFVPLWRRRGRGDLGTADAAAAVRAQHDHPGEVRGILVLGGLVPALVLAAVFAWSTVQTSAFAQPFVVDDPDAAARADVVVVGHQWWWEVRYPRQGVVTANEVHLPVGRRVRIALVSDDVNHSFWVPRLAGKTDLVAGQTNTLWLEADSAGTYYGECAEFCGPQHAHMGLTVVAEDSVAWHGWLAAQHAPAAAPSRPDAVAGAAVFANVGCAACHAVRGTRAQGMAGPDLTHVAGRASIAAGTLPNTRGNLAGWIGDPQQVKPGNRMPLVPMTGADLQAVVSYLETLK